MSRRIAAPEPMAVRETAAPPHPGRLAHQLLATPAITRISTSAYDTAMVATLRTHDDTAPLLPSAARWLVANQHPDGSWGGSVEAPHDRCVCTLAAVVALTEIDRARVDSDLPELG